MFGPILNNVLPSSRVSVARFVFVLTPNTTPAILCLSVAKDESFCGGVTFKINFRQQSAHNRSYCKTPLFAMASREKKKLSKSERKKLYQDKGKKGAEARGLGAGSRIDFSLPA